MLSLAQARTLIRVQSWAIPASIPSQIEQALHVTWPTRTGEVVSGPVDVVCIGPSEWLVSAADSQGGPLLQLLNDAFAGTSLRATDVSSALTCIRIEGPDARVLLSKGCSIDFHPQAFPTARSARTRLAGLPVVLRCFEDAHFECFVSRSYQQYLLSWLRDAAVEMG